MASRSSSQGVGDAAGRFVSERARARPDRRSGSRRASERPRVEASSPLLDTTDPRLCVARSAMSRSWLDAAGVDGAPEDLWEDGDRRFYKISRESTGGIRHAYLAVLPATDPPTRGCLRRLEHEYALKDHVDAGWAL